MGYNREYEERRANEVAAELREYLDSGDFQEFKDLYQRLALRYLTKKRRDPLYREFLQAVIKDRRAMK